MSIRPKLEEFSDPLQFFRATHDFLSSELTELEELLNDLEARGLVAITSRESEWLKLMDDFGRKAPWHEDDEEAVLFPFVASKVPHVGFQPSSSAFRFLIDGHEAMRARTKQLGIAVAQAIRRVESANPLEILAAGREFISLYRDHISTEEEKVYAPANRNLSPYERITIMTELRKRHDANSNTPVPSYHSTLMGMLGQRPQDE